MKKDGVFAIWMVLMLVWMAHAAEVTGDWLLLRMVKGDQTREVFQKMSFRPDGMVEQMGFQVASWSFDAGKKEIMMKSDLDKDFNGVLKVKTLSDKELVFEKDGAVYYLRRIDAARLRKENQEAQLTGVWRSTDGEEGTQYLKFTLPDEFTLVGVQEGSSSESHGNWMYDSRENVLYVFAMTHFCDGKNQVVEHSQNSWKIKNRGQEIHLTRMEEVKVDTLSFAAEDLPEGDPAELPLAWKESSNWYSVLAGVKQLDYRKGHLLSAVGVLEYQPVVIKVQVNEAENYLSFAFSTSRQGEMSQYKEAVKDGMEENPFFPQEEMPFYRVVGQETITVPAGTFACTVVEAYDDFDERKMKLWMVNDKPGVYARWIESKKNFSRRDVFVWELNEIQ